MSFLCVFVFSTAGHVLHRVILVPTSLCAYVSLVFFTPCRWLSAISEVSASTPQVFLGVVSIPRSVLVATLVCYLSLQFVLKHCVYRVFDTLGPLRIRVFLHSVAASTYEHLL